jgi:hypothetical protein
LQEQELIVQKRDNSLYIVHALLPGSVDNIDKDKVKYDFLPCYIWQGCRKIMIHGGINNAVVCEK